MATENPLAGFSRRKALAWLGALTTALIGPLPAAAVSAPDPAFPCDLDAARHVGRRYLAMAPGEADAHCLCRELGISRPGRHAAMDRSTLAHLAELRREDFAHGRTVIIDGWLLARAEARLCALASLI
jgi:hypothetical protein